MSDKSKEELAEEWLEDRLGIDYVKGLLSVRPETAKSMIEEMLTTSYLAGYEAGRAEGLKDVVSQANDRLGMMSCPCLRVVQNICTGAPMPVDGVIPEEK